MKKLRFVVPTLVLAVAMMGAGYAAWSDTLTINNTVDTGQFEFNFSSASVTNKSAEYLTVTPPATPAGKTLAVDIDNAYPGATATITTVIDNTSTIPATLTLTPDISDELQVTSITVNGLAYTAPVALSLVGGVGEDATIVYTVTALNTVVESTPTVTQTYHANYTAALNQ